MKKYIPLDDLIAEIDKLENQSFCIIDDLSGRTAYLQAISDIFEIFDTLEVKGVNEVPATVMVNKYGNRFISSWPGLKEYDNLKEGEEIKIVIPKK